MRKLGGLTPVLLALLMGAAGALPARAQDFDRRPAQGSDAQQFRGELRNGGAIKFYEDTEEILRAGKFERAYIRYIFLNAHIRSSPLDRGLVPMVDQRLHFLREQMHLVEGMQYAAQEERPKRKSVAKPVCPPPPKEAKPKASEDEEKPPEKIIPPTPPEEKPATPPKEEAKAPAPEAPKPAAAPSTWERLKSKLMFWRKDGG